MFFLELSIKNIAMQQQPYVEKPDDTRIGIHISVLCVFGNINE